MNKLSPLLKGIITGVVMLAFTLFSYYKLPPGSPWAYLLHVLYAAGIGWTLISFSQSPSYTGKFGQLFGQGFRCFIVVTLILVTFTGIFSATHPEFAERDSDNYREYLEEKFKKEKTPAERDEMVATYKKHYTTTQIYSAIFGYLIAGSIFTAVGAGLILTRKK